jgi:hypothetical protein
LSSQEDEVEAGLAAFLCFSQQTVKAQQAVALQAVPQGVERRSVPSYLQQQHFLW